MPDTPQIRPCDGCDVVDDHPRLHFLQGAQSLQFHYDCTPRFIREAHPSPGYAAADGGKRGPDVAAVIVKHAEKLQKESN